MTGIERFLEVNPFSSPAVARAGEIDGDDVTIPTSAIREAFGYLDAYLSTAAAGPERAGRTRAAGTVLAVVGDYGSGKTHLVRELLRRARLHPGTYTVAVDASSTFVALYQRFVERLSRAEVKDRVREYYAEIVAASLLDSEITAAVGQLVQDGEVDPQTVVDRLGLMESRFLQELRERLRVVTDNAAFGTALTLLLRPGFDGAVWEWFTGQPPDQILVERGISTALDTESSALEAMGVFALLHGGRGHRMVLALDELEKVLGGSSRPAEDIASFRTLMSVCTSAGAFLVLAGLPDFLDALGDDVKQRIGPIVEMTPLTGEQVQEYVAQSQERITGEATLLPFTKDTVDYVVRLAGGLPRRVILLLHQVFRAAAEAGSGANEATVRDAARRNIGMSGRDDARAEIRRVLDGGGYRYFRDHLVTTSRESIVDYWVEVDGADAGCALLLADAVLNATDVERLVRRVAVLRGGNTDVETLLVVSGVLAPDHVAELTEQLGSEPLVYRRQSFAEDLAAAVGAAMRRLANVTGSEPIGAVRERVERLNRQQAYTLSAIEQLAVHLDELRSTSEHRLTTLQGTLEDVSRTVAANQPDGSGPADNLRLSLLPSDVDQLFDSAANNLDGLRRVDAMLRAAFPSRTDERAAAVETRQAIRSRLRSDDAFLAAGVAVMLLQLLDAFRDGISEWYRSRRPGTYGQVDRSDVEHLDLLCRSFESIYEYLPLFRLDPLGEWTVRRTDHDGTVGQATRLARRLDLRDTFDGFAARVQAAVRESLDRVVEAG